MRKNTYIYLLFIFCIFLFSCSHDKGMMLHLDNIDSLMEESPKMAYDSLQNMKRQCETSAYENVRMKWQLLDAKAKNKLFMSLPSDSIFCKVVEYYEKKGSSNEKMISKYLLGCISRDMNDAPKAIEFFKKAVDYADTTVINTDFNMLFRIYGQMGDVYSQQYLSDEALNSYSLSSYYAKKAGDIKNSIIAMENKVLQLYIQGDTVSALKLLGECHESYLKNGYSDYAAGVYPILIYTLLNRGQYSKARHYMDIYETESNLFDVSGQPITGYEHYYKAKAYYCLGVNKLDSAEWYFRKLGTYHYDYESSKGLLDVFTNKNCLDSVKKYSAMCERDMDNVLKGVQANATLQTTALYSYERLKKEADDNRYKKDMMTSVLVSFVVLVLVSLSFIYSRFRVIRSYNEKKLFLLNDRYLQICRELNITKANFENVKAGVKPQINSYVKRIDELEQEKHQLLKDKNVVDASIAMKAFKSCDVYKTIKKKTTSQDGNSWLSEKDWDDIEAQMIFHFPLLSEKITSCHNLSVQERRVCALVWLGFGNSEIQNLLNSSPQVLSNAKRSINSKLFAKESAKNLGINLKNLYYWEI